MLSEQHPELGAFGNGLKTYSRYDVLGNPHQIDDGLWSLDYAYDAAGRPSQVAETGTGRLWKQWTYGFGTSAGNRNLGQVATRTRHNWIVPPWGNQLIDVQVTETYTYGGRGGRISRVDTDLSAGQSFTYAATWGLLGNLETETAPECRATFTGCASALPVAGQRRTTTYHLTQGRVTAVTGTRGGSAETWVSSVEVHPDGRPFRTVHGNGVTDTIWPDPNGLSRPGSIAISGASKNWNSGAYAWDGAGNVSAIGTDSFLYDRVSRLADATIHTHPTLGAVPHRESYRYDAFGNLLEITGRVGSGSPQTRTLTTNSATNRLTSAAFDPAGSVTAWAGQTFDRDPFGMVWRMPGKVLIYGPSASGSDERIWEFAFTDPADGSTYEETYSLRGLDGLVRRQYRLSGGSTNGTWSWLRDPIHRDGKLLAAALPGGAERHYSLDHLGTPRLVTDQNATTLATPAYLPYGEEITPSATGEPLRFTGHERDLGGPGTTDDLDYMHARYCSPHLGRFLRVDPAQESAVPGKPQSFNRYSYARNNPLLRFDPDGQVDQRSDQDRQITESKEVLKIAGQLIASTATGLEYGALAGQKNNGDFVASPIYTSNHPGQVSHLQGIERDPSGNVTIKGTGVAPIRVLHTHLTKGKRYPVPGTTQDLIPTRPEEPSEADKTFSQQTGVIGYILTPSEELLIRVNTDRTYEILLSQSDYRAWAQRAKAAK